MVTKAKVFKEHKGGKAPVAADVVVDYRLRSGAEGTKAAGELVWTHGIEGKTVDDGSYVHHDGDIVAWREHTYSKDGEAVEEVAQPLDEGKGPGQVINR